MNHDNGGGGDGGGEMQSAKCIMTVGGRGGAGLGSQLSES